MVYLGFLQGAAAIPGLGEAGLQARYLMEPALVVAPMDPPSIVMIWPAANWIRLKVHNFNEQQSYSLQAYLMLAIELCAVMWETKNHLGRSGQGATLCSTDFGRLPPSRSKEGH